jgi:alkylation response protein AidB-like acyl-CoA dehydrogenase
MRAGSTAATSPPPREGGVHLTPERLALQQAARDFTMREVLPVANELDPVRGAIPMELREKMAEMGFFGMLIPEEFGGLGLGVFEYCLVTEELARGWMSVASLMARGNGIGGGFSDEQRRRILPLAARGQMLGAFALSEPEAGSDAANLSCRAERTGDGWLITGAKMWCTFADGAHYIVLFARTSPPPDDDHRHHGISAFLIEKEPGRFPPGLTASPIRKIGYFGWQTWNLFFDGLRLPPGALLGEEGRGFRIAMAGLEVGRAHTAARAIGLARGALEDSVAYARSRVQFGQPIGSFQAIRFRLAEMATDIEAARALLYSVCAALDSGHGGHAAAAMAKLFASEMAERVTSQGLQIHGGAGYTTDFAVERYWRDARLTTIFEGTSDIQKRVISDRILKGRN